MRIDILVVSVTFLLMFELWNTADSSTTSTSTTVVKATTPVITLAWSSNVSAFYPASSPLNVQLGVTLKISCPPNATSNIWIQEHLEQYQQCDCNASAVSEGSLTHSSACVPGITTRQICQDEVLIAITSDSKNLDSALSFEPDTTYYFISYSPGDRPLAGYWDNTSGGECLRGYKMALYVQPIDAPTTTQSIIIPTTLNTSADLSSTTSEGTITEIGAVSTQTLYGNPFIENTNTTTSGAVNLNCLSIKFMVCFVIMVFVSL